MIRRAIDLAKRRFLRASISERVQRTRRWGGERVAAVVFRSLHAAAHLTYAGFEISIKSTGAGSRRPRFGPAGDFDERTDTPAAVFFGVDLGGTNIKAGVVDDTGRALWPVKQATRTKKAPNTASSGFARRRETPFVKPV